MNTPNIIVEELIDLNQQLDARNRELEAQLDAARKQEPVGHFVSRKLGNGDIIWQVSHPNYVGAFPLYRHPVSPVLRDLSAAPHSIEQVMAWADDYERAKGHALIVQMLRSYAALISAAKQPAQQAAAVGDHGENKRILVLPELKDGQAWCCENGCGDCEPKESRFEYSRTEYPNGEVESKSERVHVSSCCDVGLLLWDEGKQDFVRWEYIDAAMQSVEEINI